MKQTQLLKKQASAYGGILLRTRKGRSRPRPLSTKYTMHLVLRSSRATGKLSMRHAGNEGKIRAILSRFSTKYGIHMLALANVGNHLHLHIKLKNRHTYKPFIRALTAAIAMAIIGSSRWKPAAEKFWDYRPFSRIVEGLRAFLTLRDYLDINQLEGLGHSRRDARLTVNWQARNFSSA